MIYAGIGSRQAKEIPSVMEYLTVWGKVLAILQTTLRSGGADGADAAFEKGCDSQLGKKEIFLPWRSFNNNSSNLFRVPSKAFELAQTVIKPDHWNNLSVGGKKLHARNSQQIFGKDLSNPCDFVVCWTVDGQTVGGTRTAIVLAENHNIPVFNLGRNNSGHSNGRIKLIEFLHTYLPQKEREIFSGMVEVYKL